MARSGDGEQRLLRQTYHRWGMLVPERYARKVRGEAERSVAFSMDLNELSESMWPIMFAGTPVFGNLSISVQPAATVAIVDKITLKLSNRSLLKSEDREEMLRAAFIDVEMSVTASAGDFRIERDLRAARL